MTDLIKLAERVEAFDERDDYSLRSEIATALGWRKKQVGGVVAWYSPDQPDIMKARPPKWLTSLDEAMSLVPEGLVWKLGGNPKGGFAGAGLFGASVLQGFDQIETTAATPALALTAAALHARSKT